MVALGEKGTDDWVFTLRNMMEAGKNQGPKAWEKITAVVFGVIFVCALLAIAIFIPRPTQFQVFVFRVVLALAAAGLGAVIPGLIHVQAGAFVRAGGAIALFVIVFWFNPPQLFVGTELQDDKRGNGVGVETVNNDKIGIGTNQDHQTGKLFIKTSVFPVVFYLDDSTVTTLTKAAPSITLDLSTGTHRLSFRSNDSRYRYDTSVTLVPGSAPQVLFVDKDQNQQPDTPKHLSDR